MADEYAAMLFEGDGPFLLPKVSTPIAVALTKERDGLLIQWALPDDPSGTQKLVQLPASFGHSMQLMVLLKKWQEELDLPEPEGPSETKFH